MALQHMRRVILMSFAAALAIVLATWSYTSRAADINNSLNAGPNPVGPNQTVVLTGRNFQSDERVGIWVTYPNFKVYPVAEIRADGDGNFTFTYLPNFVGEPSGRYVYTAFGHETGREVFAYLDVDTSEVPVGLPGANFVGLSVSPNAAAQLGSVTITGRGYEDGETVFVWITYPDFSVEEIDEVEADDDGNFSLTFTPTFKGNGEYIFSAQGGKSARAFYAELQLGPVTTPDPGPGILPTAPEPEPPPEPTAVPATPAFSVNPSSVSQSQAVTLTGSGFADEESVSIWVTFPDTRVETVTEVRADDSGNFSFTYTPNFLGDTSAPAGSYIYTARGNATGQELFAELQVAKTQAPPVPTATPVPPSPDTPDDTGVIETSLVARPEVAHQNDTVTLEGRGFSPQETVAIWITYPNFEVFAVAEVETNTDGNFTYPYVMDFLGATFTPTGKYTYTARGKSSGREVYADIRVEVPEAPGTSAGVVMQVEPMRDAQGAYFRISGANFGGSETLALWLRYPDNTVADQGQIQAGPDGTFSYVLRADGAPTGRYALTARGLTTGLNGIAEFEITPGDLTVATGEARLTILPSENGQRSFALFEGSGYQPGEVVSIWVTLPDNSTLAIGDVTVDDNGGFVASLYLGEQEPVGTRAYTAYGNTSGRRAIAEYTLAPGGAEATP